MCKLLYIIQLTRRIKRVCATRPPMQKIGQEPLTPGLSCPTTVSRKLRHERAAIHENNIMNFSSNLKRPLVHYCPLETCKFKPTTKVSTFYLDDGSVSGCSNQTSLPGSRCCVLPGNSTYESSFCVIKRSNSYILTPKI